MASMNAFTSDAFSHIALSGVVDKMDYKPSLLGALGIFEAEPVNGLNVFIDRRDGVLSLIESQPDGAPPHILEHDTRDAVSFRIRQLAKRFTIYAREVEQARAFGTTSELEAVMQLYNRRLMKVRQDMELTHEHHRLGALQGKVLDADGSTVLYDFFTEFGEPEAAAINFQLSTATTDVMKKCTEVTRGMERSARGSFTTSTSVHALAGDTFYDNLNSHPFVRDTYLNQAAASAQRENKSFRSFQFGGITWHNYRGTDDGSTVAIAATEAKFFPVGATDMFKHIMAPIGTVDFVNTPGQSTYAMNIPDRERNMWVKGELYSFPLFMCQQPRVLRKAVAA